MAVDYDLVILGGTPIAREAALKAARQGARVGLIEPPQSLPEIMSSELVALTLAQAASQPAANPDPSANSVEVTPWTAAPWRPHSWQSWQQGLALAAETLAAPLSFETLAATGVDVVIGAGEFHPTPLAVTSSDRQFRSRHYLIASGSQPTQPAIPGLAAAPQLLPEDLPHLPQQPASIIILGGTATAIALAQSLALLGTHTTLITRGPHLLPAEDRELAQWLEALLLAAGVKIHVDCTIKAAGSSDTAAYVELADTTLCADYLCLATRPTPAVADLRLPQVGVKSDRYGLIVDQRLRTTHPRIYGAGSVLGGYRSLAVGRYEAAIAVHNALYLPRQQVSYRTVPYAVYTQPSLGRVGLTERQARRWYGDEAWSLSLPIDGNLQSHLQGPAMGLCKLVGLKSGRLLGAHILAPQAAELVQTLALLMQQGMRLPQMADFPAIPHSLTDLLIQAADHWRQRRWQPGHWRRDWAENWFNWQRSRQR